METEKLSSTDLLYMEKLKEFLHTIKSGPLDNVTEIRMLEKLLSDVWDSLFQGSRENYGTMKGYKLIGRMENVKWYPPYLEFEIDRHGSTALGSTRAEIHYYKLDIDKSNVVKFEKKGYRQIKTRSRNLDLKPNVDQLIEMIQNRESNDRLVWGPGGKIKIQIGKIISNDGYKQTVTGRRKRFRKELNKRLAEIGWIETGTYIYERSV